jgi:hypothetical protein
VTAFTRLGSAIWDWEPFTNLSSDARVLWLALFTSGEAKRNVPGLWQGGIASMVDAARMERDAVVRALDDLLVDGMVEYDQVARVARLCQLPDAGEYPHNGNVVRSWWRRFNTVPVCLVRDAHVRTIRWLMEEGARQKGESLTPNHLSAWETTFGRITIPEPRRRGVRRLADSDTSTQIQPSLFPSGALPSELMPPSMSTALLPDRDYTYAASPAVDNSVSLRQMNKIRYSETVSQTVGIPDTGSRSPDLDLLPERGIGGGHDSGKPQLSVVQTYSTDEVVAVLRTGMWDPMFDETHQDALSARVDQSRRLHVTMDDWRVLAKHSTLFRRTWDARRMAEADIAAIVAHARKQIHDREDRLAMAAEFGIGSAGSQK